MPRNEALHPPSISAVGRGLTAWWAEAHRTRIDPTPYSTRRLSAAAEQSWSVMTHDQPNRPTTLPYATPPARRPVWVKVGLWGFPNHASAWAFLGVCMVVAAFSAVRGLDDPRWFWGVG